MSTLALNKLKAHGEWYLDKLLDKLFKNTGVLRPIDVEKAICKAIDEGAQIFSSAVYAPNKITVRISPDDMNRFSRFMETFRIELQKTAAGHIQNNFLQDTGRTIALDIVEDRTVSVGKVVCEAEFND